MPPNLQILREKQLILQGGLLRRYIQSTIILQHHTAVAYCTGVRIIYAIVKEWRTDIMRIRRLFTILLAVAILFTFMPGMAFAASEGASDGDKDIASGKSGSCDWVIDADGVLTISGGTLGEWDWQSDVPWDDYRNDIREVRAYGMIKLLTGDSMFSYCRNLTFVDTAFFDTSQVTDMTNMFNSCYSLKDLDLSGFDTAKTTDMRGMFQYCDSIRNLNVSHFDTSNVTNMHGMFGGCSSLEYLDVSGFDTSNVTDMEHMFVGCESLTELDVAGFDTSKVTDLGMMFSGCESLTELDVTGFNTSKVTDMARMFRLCSALTKVDVSGFDTSNVIYMDGMFEECNNLTSLDVSNFNTNNVNSMNSMFSDCKRLKSIDTKGFRTPNVTDLGMMFSGCSSLESIDVSGFDTSKVTDMYGMFYGCAEIPSLDLTNFNTEKVTDMRRMFEYCDKLEYLDISSFDMSSVEQNYGMFGGVDDSTCGSPDGFTLKLGKWNGGAVFPMDMKDLSTGTIYTKDEKIPALNYHTFTSELGGACNHVCREWITIKAPSCNDEGIREGECTICHNTVQESIPMTNHAWGTDYEIDKAATCTVAGSKSIHCILCGEIKNGSTIAIPPNGHKIIKVAAKAATTNRLGNIEYWKCSVCNRCFSDASGKNEISEESTVVNTRVGVISATLPLKFKQKISAASNLAIAPTDSVVKVESSNNKIVAVTGKNIKAGKKKGVAEITCTLNSGQELRYKVKVQKAKVKGKITIECPSKVTLTSGEKITIGASKSPVSCTDKFKYTSSKKKVATVSKSGVITAKNVKKKTTIKVTVKLGSSKKVIKVTVVPKAKA